VSKPLPALTKVALFRLNKRLVIGLIDIAVFLAVLAWLLVDAKAEGLIASFSKAVWPEEGWAEAPQRSWQAFGSRASGAHWAALAVLVALQVLAAGAEFGFWLKPGRNRPSMRRLLMLTALVALWCGLLFQHDEVTWQGKRWRSLGRIDALQTLAESLQSDWPSEDGHIAGVGPFMAYPFGQPRVLILLTPFPIDDGQTRVAAVERSVAGALRFQLAGRDGGDWIEWHRDASRPASFTGGLAEVYRLERQQHLRGDWYLVRYHVGSAMTLESGTVERATTSPLTWTAGTR
jgi:hypothetical protein